MHSTSRLMLVYPNLHDRMELALQVVGLKMTGKIEDARDVAMRIVNTTGPDNMGTSVSSPGSSVQLAGSSRFTLDPIHLLRTRFGEADDFEKLILDFLSVLDTPLTVPTRTISSTISHTTASGQTMLHLATFLGFSRVVQFLLDHGVDVDARDKNGYTALHFAALKSSSACARQLIEAGAALDIVDALGRTAAEIAPVGLFEDLFVEDPMADDEDSADSWSVGDREDEAAWGDVEEAVSEDDVPPPVRSLRRRNTKQSQHRDRASHKPAAVPLVSSEDEDSRSRSVAAKKAKEAGLDEKQMAASIMEMVQRTFAQLQYPQGMMPNLPLHLPGMPAWGTLPQMPAVFPVFVPMPTLLWGDRRPDAAQSDSETERAARTPQWLGIPTAQEWKAMWDRWALTMRPPTDEAPPAYTPRSTEEVEKPKVAPEEASAAVLPPPATIAARRVGYEPAPVAEQEVQSYGYRPVKKQSRKQQKKHDRMLILFWIPILFSTFIYSFRICPF